MKVLLFILFLCVLQVTVNAWVGIIRHDANISLKHEGHCYTESYNIGALNAGEVKRIEGRCAIAKCRTNKDISLTGCGTRRIDPPCVVVAGDLSKPFPDCCFEIKCPENNEI